VKRELHRRVDASVEASRPRDFAVRFKRPSSESAKASTASRPTFVTMANAPLLGQDARSRRRDLPDGLSEIFLRAGLDSANQIERLRQIDVLAQAIFRPFEVIKRGVALENGHLIARRKNFTFLQD
jgi:hypothetical protein